MTKYLLAACVFLVGCSKTLNQASSPVAKANQYAAQIIQPRGGYCSGVWVSPRAVLTAGHCLKEKRAHSVP